MIVGLRHLFLSSLIGEVTTLETGQNRRNALVLVEMVHLAEETKRDIFHQYYPRDPEQLYEAFKKERKKIKKLRNDGSIFE